jgi:hypothetical protein
VVVLRDDLKKFAPADFYAERLGGENKIYLVYRSTRDRGALFFSVRTPIVPGAMINTANTIGPPLIYEALAYLTG